MPAKESRTYLIQDTLEAYIKDSDDNTYFYGLTTEGSVSRNMTQELIKAGIGSKVIGTMNEEDGYDISVTTGIHYKDVIELQTGGQFESVTDIEVVEVKEDPDTGAVTATPKTVAGDVLELETGSIPKYSELQLRTVAYDPETNEVVADIYYIFDRVSPQGEFEHSFGMGDNNVQDVSFQALVPTGKESYGRYVIVPRVEEPTP